MGRTATAYTASIRQTPFHFPADHAPGGLSSLCAGPTTVVDATRKCTLSLNRRDDGFMIMSGPGNRQLVARSVQNIAAVRDRLGPDLRAPVLPPIAVGEVDGFTYAVWRRQRPLSGNRFLQAFQKRRLAPKIYDWLFEACRVSAFAPQDPQAESFAAPLARMESDSRQTDSLRASAAQSLARLASGAWAPKHAIQHSDFWLGNILLPSGHVDDEPADFFVIDWAGAALDGFPIIDFIRIAQSLGASAERRDLEVKRYCAALSCEPEDVAGYALCALGALGANLEHFPEDRYLQLCQSVYGYISRA